MLSTMSDEEIQSIVDRHGLPKATENTITDEEELFEEIRDTGVAFNREESVKDVHTVSVPLVLEGNTAIGAFTIAGPAHRLKGDRLTEQLPDKLNEAVNELKLNLRYGDKTQPLDE